jgi:hypothetical protein
MIFACPQCGQKLRAADDAAGKHCRCTQCSALVPIPKSATNPAVPVAKPVVSKPAVTSQPAAPGTPVVPRLVGASPQPDPLAAELDALIEQRRQQRRRQAVEQAEQRKQVELQQRVLERKAQSATKGDKPKGPPVFLSVLLASLGVLGLFCCGAVGLLYWKNLQPAVTLQVGGYQATAYGKATEGRQDGTTDAKGIVSSITGSEFWIASVQIPDAAPFTIDDLRARFSTSAISVEVVQRGALQGIKCQPTSSSELGLFQNLRPEMEIFVVPNQLILLAYIPGSHKQSAGVQTRALPVERERRHDNPERFFESLQAVSQLQPP